MRLHAACMSRSDAVARGAAKASGAHEGCGVLSLMKGVWEGLRHVAFCGSCLAVLKCHATVAHLDRAAASSEQLLLMSCLVGVTEELLEGQLHLFAKTGVGALSICMQMLLQGPVVKLAISARSSDYQRMVNPSKM